MKPTTTIFKLVLLFGLVSLHANGQQDNLVTYKNDTLSIEYPASWQMTNEDGVLNFFPKENYGAVTFSFHQDIELPADKIREFILDMYEIKDKPANVKMTDKGEVTEFYYEHTDKKVKWVTKAFRKKTDFYLLTINCDLDKWELNKDIFLKVLNSFKPASQL